MNVNKPKTIVLHHSLSDFKGDQLYIINQYHKEQFGLLSSLNWYVGYHFVIEKSGKVIQCRALDEEGTHAIGWNLKSIGVCICGDFNKELPTKAQIDAFISLQNELKLPLKFHRDVQAYRTCPGPINKSLFEPAPILPSIPDEEVKKAEELKNKISLLMQLVSALKQLQALLLGK